MGRYDDEVAGLATPLTHPGDLDVLLDRVGDTRVVMLGEATHGTHEFYTWRAAITRRLIEERGFSFVAVEGDWPDCDRVDRSVRCRPDAPADPRDALALFDRWPTWMWANEETVDFTRWLRSHNARADEPDRVGFHGLDVYSLWESLREILTWLREHDPEQVPAALAAYRCFQPFDEDPQQYALATRIVPAGCENEVVDLLVRLRERAAANGADGPRMSGPGADGPGADGPGAGGFGAGGSGRFGAWQNAEVVAGAERYYRTMARGGRESWNVRDRHMDDTLTRLLDHYGPDAKAIVWAHNTHVGDARATDMIEAGEINIGQLARQRYGANQVMLVGFGTHHGTVVAAGAWGAPMEVLPVPPGRRHSLEEALHGAAPARSVLVFPGDGSLDLLSDELDHRAIGVVYRLERECWGNYVPTVLGERYDAFCWFDESRAVRPMRIRPTSVAEAETYPSGV